MNILDILLHSLEHPLVETLKMAPILFLAYLLMEWLEHHETSKLMGFVNKSRRVGPLIGSALGLIPQCGFSGAIAGMYATGTVTAGTLLAVILATSDEMIPLMLGARLSAGLIAGVLLLKFIVGIITGFTADLFLKKRHRENHEHIHEFCQQENCSCKDGVWISALKHTLKILLIIYIVSVALHFVLELVPENVIKSVLNFPVLSELTAGLVGLIPSCAVSVTLTQLYIEGALGIAPLMCGLLTNGGVGLLVLYRVNRNKRDNIFITLTVFVSSIIFGSLSSLFF
jgi:hypothetical protein